MNAAFRLATALGMALTAAPALAQTASNFECSNYEYNTILPAIEGKDGEPSTTIYDNSTKSTASSADKVGVAECDEYIEKYDACVTGKVPEAARAAMRSSIEQMRQLWKSAAANPQTKAALASGCKQTLETTKQSMSSYACAW